ASQRASTQRQEYVAHQHRLRPLQHGRGWQNKQTVGRRRRARRHRARRERRLHRPRLGALSLLGLHLESKVGRRLFVRFVLAAMLPVGALALYAYSEVVSLVTE